MKYTQQDMARILGVTPMTLRNWRKDKPNLYEIVMKGFAFDAMVEKSEENLKELKELQKAFEAERIGLKKRSV
ncbi:MAG: hypothetical protein AB7D43_09600 [Sulfurimonadaceae bacterium]